MPSIKVYRILDGKALFYISKNALHFNAKDNFCLYLSSPTARYPTIPAPPAPLCW